MRLLIAILALAAPLAAEVNQLTPKEIADGWLMLFDGSTLFGWAQENGAKWRIADGALIGDAGDSGWLRHHATFNDFILKADFKTAADGNSGIFLRSAPDGRPWDSGYELQIFDQHPKFPTGSLVDVLKAKAVRPTPDQWHSYEVFCVGDHFVVKLDGKKIVDGHNSKSKIGQISLQYNKGKSIAFRNLKVKPLGFAPLFNGKTLSGWQEVKPARAPAEPPVWSAKKGVLHVEKGPGQLESKNTYDDFTLQLDIRANSTDPKRHPNSGVFFRGQVNAYWTGYESQIRNEFKDNDRTKPVDFGSGAIYHYSPARKVVSSDNEFFTKTINAKGRRFVIWINGYPVTDWEDPHPEGTVVAQKQAILKAGPIALQAHDPTTNLDFKNIKVRSLK